MKWIEHSRNYEAAIPRDLRIAFWVSVRNNSESGYSACIYMAGKLICSWDVRSAKEGKELCMKWLDCFVEQLEELRQKNE